MAVGDPRQNVQIATISATHPTLGTPAGAKVYLNSPYRGQLLECGFLPASNITSATTLQVAVNDFNATQPNSTLASVLTTVITSTIGTFASGVTYEGAVCSVLPASPTFINPGAVLQFTTSGGHTSVVTGTVYATIRRD